MSCLYMQFLKVSLDAVFDIVEDGSDDSILAFQSLVSCMFTGVVHLLFLMRFSGHLKQP